MTFYRHTPTQLFVFILFQGAMLVNFQMTHYNLLGAYVLGYVFCLLWGNIGYIILSDLFFCLGTVLFFSGSLGMAMDTDFWYLLFTLVPSLLIVYLRNQIIRMMKG